MGIRRRVKRDMRANPYEFRKNRESLKKFRKYTGKKIVRSSKYRSGNDQPKIRKIEVI